MRAGGYVRVSTQEQAKEGYSIGAQTERLGAYCKAKGWTLHELYTDPGYSGAKMTRPALQKLISDVKSGQLDLVLVYKLDRLSRSQKDTLHMIEDIFLANNVAFVSINENFDTSTAFGRAMVGILSVFAQLEREQIKERSQMGRIERAKDGLWKGGGCLPVGYTYNETTNELQVDDYEAAQVREVFDLYVNQQYSVTGIQKAMTQKGYTYRHGSWRFTSTVKNVLQNPIYIGVIRWNGEQYPGKHTPLIDAETFQKAQRRLANTSWRTGENPEYSPFSSTQLLTGIIFCKHCDARYYGSGGYRGSHKLPNSQKQYIHVYVCYSRSKTKADMIKDPNCKNKRWRAEQLDRQVINSIYQLSMEDGYFESVVTQAKSGDNKKAILQSRIAELTIQIGKMLDLYQFQDIPAAQIAPRLEALTAEKHKLESAVNSLPDETPQLPIEQARALIYSAKDVLESGSVEEQRNLIHALIRRIDLDNDDVYITWRFL